jgi:thioredoxin-related protein
MKAILFSTLLFLSSSLFSQVQKLTWHTDLEKAMQISLKEKKPLMLFFTGSDWCGWCIRLQNEVFKQADFKSWAQEKVVLVELDFPRKTPQSEAIKNQNATLSQMFEVKGYPTVWFVKPSKAGEKINLEKIGSTGYVAGGPGAWLLGANQILGVK